MGDYILSGEISDMTRDDIARQLDCGFAHWTHNEMVEMVRLQDKRIEELTAQLEHYQNYEIMVAGVSTQAHEYFGGNVSAVSLDKFRVMLKEALENK